LRGAGGEPIEFARTLRSHGCAELPPASIPDDNSFYGVGLRLAGRVRRITISAEEEELHVRLAGPKLAARARAQLTAAVRRMFRLDEDFAPFYNAIESDPQLSWATKGAGRMLASPTVFEDVVKTICTTNCAWSGTVRMVSALVNDLGGGAFPEPELMAKAPPGFYRDKARAGYRGAYLRALAKDVTSGALDLELLRPEQGLPDGEVEERLLALPGVGPYACAHIMMLLGRYHRLVFDSWTRPAYLRITGKRRVSDRSIERAFRPYGAFAGLAFWLTLTRGWVPG
jgi:3-methyladenine DNA glycosylase/8-oxoguanine DNA glycosylase